MLIFLLAYLGGVLTILSPCILPVLPFVFARSDRPFIQSGLPLLLGMAVTFAGVATLAAVAGGWAVAANEYGRIAAMVLFALFGVTLLFPALSDRLTRPIVALGERLTLSVNGRNATTMSAGLSSLLLGVATGFLWAPCAGPILGLILTGAALEGANATTTLLLLAYAAGAATSLALALLVGGRVFAFLKRSLGVGEWVRRGLGVLVLVAVGAIGLGLDTGFLTQVSLAGTNRIEQSLLEGLQPETATAQADGGTMMQGPAMMEAPAMMSANIPGASTLPIEGAMPPLTGAVDWLNSAPLTTEVLRGKVVLVDFWTYSCINCLRAIPYVRAWAEKYKDQGLVVIGVHTPEFAFEKNVGNVTRAAADLGITYPVAIDNDYAVWRAFQNRYWPAHYFIDADGNTRHHHFGEGDYDGSERVIQQLLAEAGTTAVPTDIVEVNATGAEAAAAMGQVQSPETYVGYARAENFVSPGGAVKDQSANYAGAPTALNQWTFGGQWTVHYENATLDAAGGTIAFRFHAHDLHLVLGRGADGKPVRFKVTMDGAAPADAHGVDVDAEGAGTVTEERLYQLIRQGDPIADHTFEITFLDPGVMAYAFTFG